jgi:hypothetical protein
VSHRFLPTQVEQVMAIVMQHVEVLAMVIRVYQSHHQPY